MMPGRDDVDLIRPSCCVWNIGHHSIAIEEDARGDVVFGTKDAAVETSAGAACIPSPSLELEPCNWRNEGVGIDLSVRMR
jgi:hypothetical protein